MYLKKITDISAPYKIYDLLSIIYYQTSCKCYNLYKYYFRNDHEEIELQYIRREYVIKYY